MNSLLADSTILGEEAKAVGTGRSETVLRLVMAGRDGSHAATADYNYNNEKCVNRIIVLFVVYICTTRATL